MNHRAVSFSRAAWLAPGLLAASLAVSPAVTAAQKTPASPPPSPKAAPKAATAAVPPDQIGIVDGIPITQAEWDRLAKPYYEEVQARAGRPLNDEEKRLLQRNVLDELIRERLWLADARRRGMKANEAEIDSRMKQSAFFKTAGQIDEGKFQAFKASPTSNYPELRAQVERTLVLEEYTRWMERRFGPREAELKKTFEERTTQASLRFAVVGPDAVSLDAQATTAQARAYYEAHPDEFMGAEEFRIRYVRIPASPEGASSDSAKEAASRAALQTATGLLSELRSGASAEVAAKPYGGVQDSDWFRIGEPVRGLGRSDALAAALRAGTAGEWLREPLRLGPNYVLVLLEERRGGARLPFRSVIAQAKRKADAEVRERILDSLAMAEVREHPESYYVPRLMASWVSRGFDTFDPGKPPKAKDVEKRLQRLRVEAGVSDTERAWLDSVRVGVPDLIRWERRRDHAARVFRDVMARLKAGEDPAKVASRFGARAGGLTRYRGEPPTAPSLVEGALLDSLYALRPMDVVGPRHKADSVLAVRVERVEPAFLPPYEASRPAAHAAVLEQRRQATAREAERYFLEHKGNYRTSTRWVIDYAFFAKPKPEGIKVSEDSIAAYWREHPLEFTVPGKARVRHILVANRAQDGRLSRDAAQRKALAARKRVADGEDFAAVAREVSDDPGSSPKGGDLGEVTRGSVAKQFGEVAFTIPIGELSKVFETEFGFHFLQVESRAADRLRPLAECSEEIRGVLARDLADSTALRSATAFLAREKEAPADSASARQAGWKRSAPLSGNEPLESLGPALWLEKAVASLDDLAVVPAPIPLTEGYLAVRRIRELPPAQATFEQVRERVIADVQHQRRRAVADSLDRVLGPAFEAGADPETLFVSVGGFRFSRQFGRQGPIPDLARDPSLARDSTYLSRVFATEPGGRLPPLKGGMGTLYAVVDTVIVLPQGEFAKNRDALLHELVDQRVEAWTVRLRSKAPIRIHRKELRAQLG